MRKHVLDAGGLRNAAQPIEARADTLDTAGWKCLGRYFETQLTLLTKARAAISARSQSSWAPHLSQTMDALQKATHEVLQTGNDGKPQDLVARLESFKPALARYEDVLWKAGARRK